MKNNNQKILRLLAKREYQENKRRNRILIGTVAFAVWMIFCVFSLAIGKIQADYLLMVRNGGTKASTTLEDPSEEQYRKIQELAYIRSAGMETDFAATDAFLCTVLDKTAWENMQKPAYTDIHGGYPTKENEIMLPMRALKLLGVSKPKLGMVIPVTMTDSEGEEHSGGFPVVWILYGICRAVDGKGVRLFLTEISGSTEPCGSIENAADRTEQERGRSDGGRPIVSGYSDAR